MTVPVTVYQANSFANYGAATVPINFSHTPNVGSSIVVTVGLRLGTLSNVSGITDNQTPPNSYTKVIQEYGGVSGNYADCEQWYCPSINTSSGLFTVTATFTSSPYNQAIGIVETSSIVGFDKVTANSDGGTASELGIVANSSPNSIANDLLIGSIILSGYFPTGAGTSNPAIGDTNPYTSLFYLSGSPLNSDMQASYQNLSAIETSAINWTWTGGTSYWAATLVSYYGPSGGKPIRQYANGQFFANTFIEAGAELGNGLTMKMYANGSVQLQQMVEITSPVKLYANGTVSANMFSEF